MQIFRRKWKIPHAARKPLVFFLVFLFLTIEFRFLISDRVPDSVSLQNQFLIAQDYQILFRNFLSSGYDRFLQGGSPTFYFQSPFFFFLVSFFHTFLLFFLPLEVSFNFGILLTLFLFSYAFLKLGFYILTETNLSPGNALLVLTGLLFYLLYPGDRTVGAGIVGVFQNSVSFCLGLGFSILALYYLEKFRHTGKLSSFAKNLTAGALVFYSHYEMSLFYVISLGVYFLFYKDEFSIPEILLIFFLPFVFAFPILWNYFAYIPFLQNPPVSFPVNGLLSLLGEEFSDSISKPETFFHAMKAVFWEQYWIHLLFPVLFVVGIRLLFIRKLLPPISRFLIFGTLLFYWTATDSSLAMIFPWLHVKWYTALNVSLVFLTLSALVTARFFLKNLPSGKWKLIAGLILFLLGTFRFIVAIPGAPSGMENISKNPSEVWKDREEWSRIFSKTADGALFASEEVSGNSDGDFRWMSVLIRKSYHRNIILQNRYEFSLPATPEEIVNLFPSQGPKRNTQKKKTAGTHPVYEKEKLARLFYRLLRDRGVSYAVLRSESLHRLAAAAPEFFEEREKRGEWIVWKLKLERPIVEVLSEKPAALLFDDVSEKGAPSAEDLSEFLLTSDSGRSTIHPVPVTAQEYEADKGSFSGAFTVNEWNAFYAERTRIEEAQRSKSIISSKKNAPPKASSVSETIGDGTVYPYLWDNSRIVWSSPSSGKNVSETVGSSEVCSPTVIRSGFFPLWKSAAGETIHRTLEGQSYFCSKSSENTFVFYDIRSYFVTLIQLLLPILFFGATFLNRRKLQN
ncbi:hypothetical protein EHQ12_03020 [Leptospira gomenensis]|uniref:Membrane protein 6-pyruvoyl-tetrahydropterin synthase-related domain-containing protein n=1 Tax=Leptospira gomenensis TaxID=2484974 RepID=A0A5F1Z2A2_9LEPT|nr:hypothetical protein [Leptospira gomenensis]TGK31032.1 hypothetical protein EHQ17_15055 [Leptospira gomenensis]TGK43237.1 hypothetical protein EHQ12_03020 [Leptospira gomenensis]TGK45248.1 hypothetical protein EHQ07_09945 [Leptospira gomenensis]TGK66163.1 hypothetical protein EHQ13_03680 [Leptospira gomenensis]